MSIILKALKKAEESRAEEKVVEKSHAYRLENKKAFWIIVAGFTGLVLLFSIGIYWFKNRPVSKPDLRVEGKAKTIQPQSITKEKKKEETVVAESPDIVKLHEDAIKEIKGKNYSGAESILRKALLIKPGDAVMHNHLGLALKNQGRYKDASIAYKKALQLKPDYYEVMNNLAVTYEILGEREKAETLYKRALSIKPSYPEAHLNYALMLEAEGKNSEAESHYYTFLNLSSDEALKVRVKERLRGLRK